MKKMIKQIKIEWIHFVFRLKYPETTTDPIIWLRNYNIYIKKLQEIRNESN